MTVTGIWWIPLIQEIYGKRDSSIAGQVELLPQYKRYDRPNSLARKLKTKTCELCGGYCTELEIHQVKKLKSLKGNCEWEKLMLKRRRKTLARQYELNAQLDLENGKVEDVDLAASEDKDVAANVAEEKGPYRTGGNGYTR